MGLNYTLHNFLHTDIDSLDFSRNDLKQNFQMFNDLIQIETLVLRQVKLEAIIQIEFQNLLNLKHLDLSENNLTLVNELSLGGLKSLVYLNLSFNQIAWVDEAIFIAVNNLEYLNMSNNRLRTIGCILSEYLAVNSFLNFN